MEYQTALRAPDELKASLFELLSEAQLSALIPPSLRYLLVVATQQRPRYLLPILNSFDEIYALLMLLVEHHFLRTTSASFTESFYGLRRERSPVTDLARVRLVAPAQLHSALRLSRRDIWRNLAVLVAAPYIQRKLDDAFAAEAPRALLGSAYTRLPPAPSLRQRLSHYFRRFLRNVYPSLNAAWRLAVIAFGLAYLSDNSTHHHPLMWLVGTRLRRMSPDDQRALAAAATATARASSGATGRSGRPDRGSIFAPQTLMPRLLGSLSLLLPTSIFALKFLEWWHASDFSRQLGRQTSEALQLPPPTGPAPAAQTASDTAPNAAPAAASPGAPDELDMPAQPPIAASSGLPILTLRVPADSALCPICRAAILTPTACPTGHVFCYTCVHRWLKGEHSVQEGFMQRVKGGWESGEGRCAVTGRRVLAGTDGLRRVIV
jgi:peroxin-12